MDRRASLTGVTPRQPEPPDESAEQPVAGRAQHRSRVGVQAEALAGPPQRRAALLERPVVARQLQQTRVGSPELDDLPPPPYATLQSHAGVPGASYGLRSQPSLPAVLARTPSPAAQASRLGNPRLAEAPAEFAQQPAGRERMTAEKLDYAIQCLIGMHDTEEHDFRDRVGTAALPVINHLQILATSSAGSQPPPVIEALLNAQGSVEALITNLQGVVQSAAPWLAARPRGLLDEDDEEAVTPAQTRPTGVAYGQRALLADTVMWQAREMLLPLQTDPERPHPDLREWSQTARISMAGHLESLHSLQAHCLDPRVLRAALQAQGDPVQLLDALASLPGNR